jgi:predicted DNA-binding helix-hairpin-helix protein
MNIREKLEILANAAKYDVSCSSSGSRRENRGGGLGNSVSGGICHSFTEDGRCVSLLKILFTNYCIHPGFSRISSLSPLNRIKPSVSGKASNGT